MSPLRTGESGHLPVVQNGNPGREGDFAKPDDVERGGDVNGDRKEADSLLEAREGSAPPLPPQGTVQSESSFASLCAVASVSSQEHTQSDGVRPPQTPPPPLSGDEDSAAVSGKTAENREARNDHAYYEKFSHVETVFPAWQGSPGSSSEWPESETSSQAMEQKKTFQDFTQSAWCQLDDTAHAKEGVIDQVMIAQRRNRRPLMPRINTEFGEESGSTAHSQLTARHTTVSSSTLVPSGSQEFLNQSSPDFDDAIGDEAERVAKRSIHWESVSHRCPWFRVPIIQPQAKPRIAWIFLGMLHHV